MRYPFVVSLAGAVVVFLLAGAPAVQAADNAPSPETVQLRKAAVLSSAAKYAEAAAVYEVQLAKHPENVDLMVRLAHVLYMDALTQPEKSKALEENKRARALAQKASEFGTADPLTPVLLSSLNPDGTAIPLPAGNYSAKADVEKTLRDGEAAFTKHEFQKAGEFYRKGFEMEPTNYSAALLAGDAYFADGKYDTAAEWFRTAIALNQDEETAHRYLGDALYRTGLSEEAFNEWIAALICQPYQRLTRQHFSKTMLAAAESRGHVIPRFPAMRSTIEDKQLVLNVDPNDGLLITSYNLCALGWRAENFQKTFPAEKTARRSLAEEVFAINGMLEVAESLSAEKKEDAAKWKTVVEGLTALKRDGLLEAFVFFERADEDLAKDYKAFRTAHREQLRRYVWTYWCGFD